MVKTPRNVVVVGAGTMGSGIAAHLANLGFEVSLLDLSTNSARTAFERARRARPPHFYVPETADSVRLGSIEGDLDWVRAADWVCEAIVEKPDAKRGLFALIEPLLREEAFVSTNTSGLEIGLLSAGRGASFRRRFLGTHFFNPPRYLKLLELIPTPETDPAVTAAMTAFLEDRCARRVVLAKDTPGFIANRFGMWSMYHATHVAERLGLTVEQVDAITGPFIGRPRSGTFRLNDLVGLDIMRDIAANLVARCPEDAHTATLHPPRSLAYLLEKGWIGEKVGQGYYRREGKELMSLDLTTLAYRMRQEPDLPTIRECGRAPLGERLRHGLAAKDEVGEFLRAYLPSALDYADWLKESISHSVEDFDRVMQWGFGWEVGPFKTMDLIGHREYRFFEGGAQRAFDGRPIPLPHEPQYATVEDFPILDRLEGFNVRDMGDGVTLLSVTAKMGVYSPAVIRALRGYLERGPVKRIVLTSEDRCFSAGFDLRFILEALDGEGFPAVERALLDLQLLGLTISQIPSVAAVFGHCLGGGYEVATSCTHIAAHPETQIGLPEVRVGLVPAGGGTAHLRQRFQSSAKGLVEAARVLVLGAVSSNAEDARRLGYMRREDVTVFHPDRLLTEAKVLALSATPLPERTWTEVAGPVSGMIDQALDNLQASGEITEYDHAIGDSIKTILARAVSFEDALAQEREAFAKLLSEGMTVARIRHMLETGKPLRN